MSWWMLAMLAYPETQKRAQAEIDAVVGRSRIPTFADQAHLPYIRAMVKESLRWRPVGPVGMPHYTIEDDWYQGMFIPKDTVIIPNVWHLNRNTETYGADAEHFNPARYLDDKENKLAPGPADAKEEGHFTYGFGRRICIGRHVANNSLFLNIATILWAMNIERETDEKGNVVPLDVDGCVDHGLVVYVSDLILNLWRASSVLHFFRGPMPFQCKVTPRFPDAVSILELERENTGY